MLQVEVDLHNELVLQYLGIIEVLRGERERERERERDPRAPYHSIAQPRDLHTMMLGWWEIPERR